MGILVVGSVAFDSIQTPFGREEKILGGSATYFGLAASYFTEVHVIAVVGQDFPEENIRFLQSKGIDTTGLQRKAGMTFFWKGVYEGDMNAARTLETQLNVFGEFSPELLEHHKKQDYIFLGNIDPDLQREVLQQAKRSRLVVCDTMNYWINHKRRALERTLEMVDILIINDAETRQLTGEGNLITAARRIIASGPKTLVIKRGEYGALMVNTKFTYAAPAFPLETVVDPTGAGDSFAGGFVGYLAARQTVDEDALRKAVVFGTAMASFTVSEFGPKRLGSLTYPEIEGRFREFQDLTRLGDLP